MKKMTIVLSMTGLMTLSACMGGGTDTVTRGKYPGSESCAGLTGVSAAHMKSSGGLLLRCGPQASDPVTYAN